MKHSEYFNMMSQASGVITTDDDGNSVCTLCHGVGTHFEASVKHHKGCEFIKAVEAMQKIMPDNFQPGVENQITLGDMLPYLADVPSDEIIKAGELASCMAAAETKEDRATVMTLVCKWCNCRDKDIKDAVVEYGLPDKDAEITFRNYMVYEWSNLQEALRLGLETLAFENNQAVMLPKFRKLLVDKYPHYAGASTK